ncbi:hypothetical protein MHK_009572, partial [Candidatus Magnetomorum sp. HK-1]
MHLSNLDQNLQQSISNNSSFQGQYILYTDLTLCPLSLPTIINYANVVSIVIDLKFSGTFEKTEDRTYYRLKGNDIYRITAWIDFKDFTDHSSNNTRGSTFEECHEIYMPKRIQRNNYNLTLNNFDNVDTILKLNISNQSLEKTFVWLYNESDLQSQYLGQVNVLTPDLYIHNLEHPWVENSKFNGIFVLCDEIMQKYFQKQYSGDRARVARAIEKILKQQNDYYSNNISNAFLLLYDNESIEHNTQHFDLSEIDDIADDDK